MSNPPEYSRSQELLHRQDSALLVVDVQTKLLPAIPDRARLVWNIRRLIDGAKLLSVPILATEQYPQGLGPTVPELASLVGEARPKVAFSCIGCEGLFADLERRGVRQILLAGMETHVCIAQTAFDLEASGLRSYIAVDAVAARYRVDHETALGRMDSAGMTLTTTEAALFEWCGAAGTDEFKQISRLIQESPPA